MRQIPCGLCGSDRHNIVFKTRDRNWGVPGEFTVVRCADCGFVFLNPQPDEQESRGHYPSAFSAKQGQDEGIENIVILGSPWRDVMRLRARPLFEAKSPGRVLDIGCGDCLFLLYLKETGWEPHGVEPLEKAARRGREAMGMDVRQGFIQDADFPDGFFDAVTMNHVLEHVHDIPDMLSRVRRLLAPDGVAVFEVPNFASLESKIFRERWGPVDAPRHLYHFTPETLRRMLEKNGMEVVKTHHRSDEARIKIGYADSVRHWLSDRGIVKVRSKQEAPATPAAPAANPRASIKGRVRDAENGAYAALGKIADGIKLGGRIIAVAKTR